MTIMANSQTGTGKTFTVGCLGDKDVADRGIMVRAMENILEQISPEADQVFTCTIQDLLRPDNENITIALLHACVACSLKPSIDWIAASNLKDESAQNTPEAHAVAWKTLRYVHVYLEALRIRKVPYSDGTVEVNERIAYVSQSAWIQTGTIIENILLGSAMDMQKYQDVLEICCLVKDIDMLPFREQTIIEEQGNKLETSSPSLHRIEWEETRCTICMEFPHKAVLLICSSHGKGCWPYMCDTSYRHSNCLCQFCKSSQVVESGCPPIDLSATRICDDERSEVESDRFTQSIMFYMFRPVEKNEYFAIDDDEEETAEMALQDEEFEL